MLLSPRHRARHHSDHLSGQDRSELALMYRRANQELCRLGIPRMSFLLQSIQMQFSSNPGEYPACVVLMLPSLMLGFKMSLCSSSWSRDLKPAVQRHHETRNPQVQYRSVESKSPSSLSLYGFYHPLSAKYTAANVVNSIRNLELGMVCNTNRL